MLLIPTASGAQTAMPQAALACTTLTHYLFFGSTDYYTQGDVSKLQTFLNAEGYFPYAPVGIFGPLTRRAVQNFQTAHGVAPVGIVGPLTRKAIAQLSCSGTTTTATPYLQSVTPNTGPTGTSVSVTGYGFTSDNTILFAGGAILHVPISSSIAIACTTDPNCRGGIRQTLVFTVPSSIGPNCPAGTACPMYMRLITPGTYTLSVQNQNGTGNDLNFTVTASPNSSY